MRPFEMPRGGTIVLAQVLVLVLVVVHVGLGLVSGAPTVNLTPMAAEQRQLSDEDDEEDGRDNDSGTEDDDEADQDGDDSAETEEGDDDGTDDANDGAADADDGGDSEDSGDGDTGGGADENGDFEGRDEIGEAGADQYVSISEVETNSGLGDGGDFSGGSYSITCTLADHRNPDNPIIAPGVRNGAQHVHDYAGNESTNANSDSDSLDAASTTCTNGDRSPLFWPVLRDLNGVGPDEGQDGGSLDGNVGAFVDPSSIDITYHGHGSREIEAMPRNLILSTGAAKAATNDGEGANAKYSCSGFEDRVTDLYPLCPSGSALQRVYDFPSCWDGENLDSEDHTSHIAFPDKAGECADDEVPVPALRLTISYDDPPPGRSFAIDSFPEQQHDPITDHALTEFISSERRAEAGVACINAGERCEQGEESAARGSTLAEDQQPLPLNFAAAFATHGNAHGLGDGTAQHGGGPVAGHGAGHR